MQLIEIMGEETKTIKSVSIQLSPLKLKLEEKSKP